MEIAVYIIKQQEVREMKTRGNKYDREYGQYLHGEAINYKQPLIGALRELKKANEREVRKNGHSERITGNEKDYEGKNRGENH